MCSWVGGGWGFKIDQFTGVIVRKRTRKEDAKGWGGFCVLVLESPRADSGRPGAEDGAERGLHSLVPKRIGAS